MDSLIDPREYAALSECTYLNQASLGLIPRASLEASVRFLNDVAQHGNLRLSDQAEAEVLDTLRTAAAGLLGAPLESAAVVGGASEGLSQLAAMLSGADGEVILVPSDFPSVTYPWLAARMRLLGMADKNLPAGPCASGALDVGDGHTVYWETVGNPAGTPAVYLHGGPGSGSSPRARAYFDPAHYRAVLFDQRGCGRSRPLASDPDADLSANTTGHLVADIERLREHLGIDRWVVAGVSWGVTLGLVYAQAHPGRVAAMVLGAVTSGTRHEIEWITRDMGRLFPAEWEAFTALVPPAERHGDLSAAYSRLLADPDAHMREAAARAWCAWEDTHVSLMPGWKPSPRYEDPAFRMVFARLVTHYWSHGCFLTDGQILAGMNHLAEIPAVLIHGRHDVSGPLDTAWALHRRWPGSRLVIVEDAGHGGGSFDDELTAALDSFAGLAA